MSERNGNQQNTSTKLTDTAIAAVAHLAERAMEPRIIDLEEHRGPRQLIVLTPEGIERIDKPQHRDCNIENIHDLAVLVNRIGKRASIWHTEDAIRVCFDDDDRKDRCLMNLQMDSRFAKLRELAADRVPMTHDAFVRMLRVDFDGAINNTTQTLLEALKFNTDGESIAKADRQTVSLRAMASLATQASGGTEIATIPDVIEVQTPVYSTAQISDQSDAVIRCRIEIDAKQAKIFMIPVVRDIDEAVMQASREVNDRLKGLTQGSANVVGIYQGNPGE